MNDDSTVTFRLRAPQAESVQAKIARVENGTVKLAKQANGLWVGTSEPMPAGIHEYSFNVDGTRQIDPLNRWVKKWYSLDSLFEVPSQGQPRLSESQPVPHGSLHIHTYASQVTASDRSMIVYTPPGYEDGEASYPVLFLLHGFGDDYLAWTEVGRANLIADNLIAQKRMQPMVIVMPYGHPEPLPYEQRPADYGEKNDAKMQDDLMQEVLPLIEKRYRVDQKAESRAIVGLSMGGGHSLTIGLNNTDCFGWIGAFSAAAPNPQQFSETLNAVEKNPERIKKLWIACGDKDFLLERNRSFTEALKDRDIPHEYIETLGSHNWSVWRDDYLPKFLQLVFR